MQKQITGLNKLFKINNVKILLTLAVFFSLLFNLFSESQSSSESKKQKNDTVVLQENDTDDNGRIVIDEIEEYNDESADEKNKYTEQVPVIPLSYGELKGSFNAGNRNILIFENSENGVITFIEVIFDRTLTWKYIGKFKRE